ncbi:hypothetical protein [Mycobacterium sp. OTB74]|jgi:hypothetical protein|uniref:hypothetical protein n=1 Tax=Mycobacterium sp. OTB74 TaxID=1853452 RepID=UPI00247510EA|nr:hypothetical protein [Mycobacterium sp. OTB74]MDH6244351.1 putative membrane protein [Mycobacterium sp. OTB74]
MALNSHRFVPARLRKSAAAMVGGSAAVALVVAALVSTGTPDSAQLLARPSHGGGGGGGSIVQPTEPEMRLGATTISPTEEMPSMPGTTPAIPFAAPKIKAGH